MFKNHLVDNYMYIYTDVWYICACVHMYLSVYICICAHMYMHVCMYE